MRSKLGIFNKEAQDKSIIEDLINMMEKYSEDYTNTFLALTFNKNINNDMFKSTEFENWYKTWQERLERQPQSKESVHQLMKDSNPAVIPRNHRVEEALKGANEGDYNIMMNLLDVISRPYDHSTAQEKYSELPQPSSCPYRTYCGT